MTKLWREHTVPKCLHFRYEHYTKSINDTNKMPIDLWRNYCEFTNHYQQKHLVKNVVHAHERRNKWHRNSCKYEQSSSTHHASHDVRTSFHHRLLTMRSFYCWTNFRPLQKSIKSIYYNNFDDDKLQMHTSCTLGFSSSLHYPPPFPL